MTPIYISLLTQRAVNYKINHPSVVKMLMDIEINSDYDPDKCHDGGGYYQPYISLYGELYGEDVVVHIDDTSCGDFGKRYYVVAEYAGEEIHADIDRIDHQEWSEFDSEDKYHRAIKAILKAVGYSVEVLA